MIKRSLKPNTTALLKQRRDSAERTRVHLHQALDRFEHDQLINIPPKSKLSLRNLATEAGVSKDTPFSRFRKGQPNAGEYRFPDLVTRFNELNKKLIGKPKPSNLKDIKIQELREVIKSLKEQLVLANRANNKLDVEAYEKDRRIKELEAELITLRRGSIRVVNINEAKRPSSPAVTPIEVANSSVSQIAAEQLPAEPSDLNDFEYFRQVEQLFVARRGKHLLISPLDWALIESWKERDIPLRVVLRGIDKTFDSYDSKARARKVNSLSYCEAEVELQHQNWINSQVGASSTSSASAGLNSRTNFSKPQILAYFSSTRSGLVRLREALSEGPLRDVLLKVVEDLEKLEQEVDTTSRQDPAAIESTLSEIQEHLDSVLLSESFQELRLSLEREVTAQIGSYRSRMGTENYSQTLSHLILKRLRKHFNLAALSLFRS